MPLEKRIESVCKKYNISQAEAERKIISTDRNRELYYNFASEGKWGDCRNYDLCIDVSKTGVDCAVEILKTALLA